MADIKTRFTIEGEQQYRKAMSDAANAVKVLNSQQKLAKAQFQNTGDAEKYAAQQADILRKKIEQQKTSVKAAEAALKQLSDQGVAANNRQMQQWQMKLNNAQTALEQMEAELKEVNSTMQETGSAAQETSSAVESIGKKVSYDAVINGMSKITGAMGDAARKAKELAGDLVSTMKDAAAWSDDLATTATVYGISTEELQRMQYTADIIDTSVESIMKARQKQINNMIYGNEEVQKTFEELGVATREFVNGKYGDVAGEFRDWEDVFWDLGEALMNIEDVELRDAMAMKIWGKGFSDLKPMFDNDWAEKGFGSAREYYEATMKSWQVVSDENVARLNALDDTIQKVVNNFDTLKGTILGELAPAFTEVGNTVSDLLAEFNEYLNSPEGQEKLSELGEAVSGLFEGLTNVDFGAALDTAKGALEALTDGLGWIKENWSVVETGLKAIGVAFGLMKVSEGVLTFMQLMSSGKFLFGGGGKSTGSGGGTEEAGAGEGWLSALLRSPIAKAAGGGLAFFGTLFENAIKPQGNDDLDQWFDSQEEYDQAVEEVLRKNREYKKTLAAELLKPDEDEKEEAKAAADDLAKGLRAQWIAEGIEGWAKETAKTIKQIDASKWFGGGWSIVENEDLDNSGPYFDLNGDQWKAAEKYWDTIREFGVMSDKATAGMMELMNAFDWTDQGMAEYEKILDMMNNMMFKGTYNGEDLPEHWRGEAQEFFEDEPVEVPTEPELVPTSQELLQAGLDLLTLRLPVTPYLTSDSWLPFYPHANGLPYVPFDGYPAVLHKGERVVPAREISSQSYSSNLYVENMNMNGGADAEGLAAAMAAAQRRTMAGFGS